jgi:hypothetical protein
LCIGRLVLEVDQENLFAERGILERHPAGIFVFRVDAQFDDARLAQPFGVELQQVFERLRRQPADPETHLRRLVGQPALVTRDCRRGAPGATRIVLCWSALTRPAGDLSRTVARERFSITRAARALRRSASRP